MKQQEIDYQICVDLGFTVDRSPSDTVFYSKYGYGWFVVYKDYMKGRISIDWDSTTRHCELRKMSKKGDVLSRLPIVNEKQLRMIDDFFTGNLDK